MSCVVSSLNILQCSASEVQETLRCLTQIVQMKRYSMWVTRWEFASYAVASRNPVLEIRCFQRK